MSARSIHPACSRLDKFWYRVPTKLNRRILLCGESAQVRREGAEYLVRFLLNLSHRSGARDLNNLSAPGGKLCREISGRQINDRSLTPIIRYGTCTISILVRDQPPAFRLTISPLRRDSAWTKLVKASHLRGIKKCISEIFSGLQK